MTITARTAALAVFVGIGTAALSAVPASAVDRPSYCDETSSLPRTADAAEAWLRSCTNALAVHLSGSADSMERTIAGR